MPAPQLPNVTYPQMRTNLQQVVNKLYTGEAKAIVTSTGAEDELELTYDPAVTHYYDGSSFNFIANEDNTGVSGSAMVTINGLGLKPILRPDLEELEQGDLLTGRLYTIIFNEVEDAFILQNPSAFGLLPDFSALDEETIPDEGDLLILQKNSDGSKKKIKVESIASQAFTDLTDVDIEELVGGKTFQVVNAGGTPKIQQVDFPDLDKAFTELTDVNIASLTVGKTFQVVNAGGTPKIQQVDFPDVDVKGMNYTRQTSNYVANPYDFVVIDSTSTRTVTFPAYTALVGGEEIAVYRQNTGTVTVTAGTGSTIEGNSTEAIPARYDVFRYIYNKQETRWERISVASGERWAGVYTGSSNSNTTFPVGTEVWCQCPAADAVRNAAVTVRLDNAVNYGFSTTVNQGSTLAGTWRARGVGTAQGGTQGAMVQRTA